MLSFVNSVVWINLIVNEILAVLFVFGVVFRLSDAVLGLTILAWGNSVQGKLHLYNSKGSLIVMDVQIAIIGET